MEKLVEAEQTLWETADINTWKLIQQKCEAVFTGHEKIILIARLFFIIITIMEEEPVQTFMTVTNTPRAFALEKLQAHEGDLNEAINAFFNEEEQNVRLQEHREARRTTLLEKDEPGEVEMESLFQSFPSIGSFFSPFAGFNRGYASNIFSGRRAFLNSTRNLEPQVSHPREVREIPIVCNDNDGSAYSNSAPSIVEIPADTVTEPGSEVKGNVIVEDDDIPCTASAVSMEDSYARGIHDPVIDIDDRDPRTSVPQITEVPVDSNVGGNAAEEEILEAAIEASKREAEAANRRLQHGQPQDILGVRTVQCTSRSEDDELAQAIALSLKTAELERALHECQGLVRSLEQVKDNNNSFVGEQGCTSMGRRQGLGSANVVTSSQVKLDVEESGRDGDYLDVFNARLQEDPDGLEHLIGHVQHTPSGSSGSAMNKCQDFESLMLSPEPRDAGSAAQQCGDPFPAKEVS